ncbi:MAG TPA: hypothetical protein VF341_10065 [Anaeromyxobacteraceae bacterium]
MTGTTPPHRPGTALFWAGLLAFVAVDAALLGGLYQGPLAKILSYALLAAFALALAYATAIASLAIGHRRPPALADAVRAGLLVALTVGHLFLIIRAARR